MNMIEQRKRNRGQSGFTLIEMLVVVAILAILGGVAVFAVGSLTDDSKASACKVEYDTLKTAVAAADTTNDAGDNADAFLQEPSANAVYWTLNLGTGAVASKAVDGMAAGQTNRGACDSI